MRRFVVITALFSLAAAQVLCAQPALPESAQITKRFEDPARIQWINRYEGTWQSFHPLQMILAYDGEQYNGTIHFDGCNQLFDLYGNNREGKILLQETDSTGRTSGYLFLNLTDEKLTGQWWSTSFKRAASVSLRKEGTVELRHFEPQLVVLQAQDTASAIMQLFVNQEEPDLLSGFGNIDDQVYRITGTCADRTCDRMALHLLDSDGNDTHLQCTKQRNGNYNLSLSAQAANPVVFQTTEVHAYPIAVAHTYNYISTIDCTYPLLTQGDFASWITGEMSAWQARASAYLDSLQHVLGTPRPEDRWSVSASAWTDITLMTPENISGIITMYDLKKGAYDRKAFLYDTRSRKDQSVESIGRKSSFAPLLSSTAEKTFFALHPGESSSFPEDISFKHIALAPQGFLCFTDFFPATGDAWILLNYQQYLGMVKRNSVVQNLIKSR